MQEGKIIKVPMKVVDKQWILKNGEYLYTVQRPDGQFRRYYESKLQKLCQKSMWQRIKSYFK